MTWTWTKVIALALVRSGVLGRGQVANAAMSADGMDALSLLLDEWDGQGLALPDFDIAVQFHTAAGRARYLLGTGEQSPVDCLIRPETIVVGTSRISTNPITYQTMVPMEYPDYQSIPVPLGTTGQPWNYAINQTWPQMEIFLYPTPDTDYLITLTCKVKWAETVGWPDLNPFAEAEVPSGYANALVDNLALKLAQTNRLETATLENKAAEARFMISTAVMNQHRDVARKVPVGLFGIDILTAGRNP